MPQEIIKICLMGVNCYLIRSGQSYVLVDTGFSFRRGAIDRELEKAGCQPGSLRLIIITHADTDHTGNAVYLRNKFGALIAMHRGESTATEKGNLCLNRKLNKRSTRIMARLVFNLPYAGLSKSDRFIPDLYIEDGYDFSEYGFDARALHLPGHSVGSIGVLTNDGELFCGDLLKTSRGKPGRNSLVDDSAEMNDSIERLKSLNIRKVYPGHGRPFTMEELVQK
jgi:hydroxyacylglutathione hydrolase